MTKKGQLTLCKELLAGRSARRASLEELDEAAASGWAGFHSRDVLASMLPATKSVSITADTNLLVCALCRTILSRPRRQLI